MNEEVAAKLQQQQRASAKKHQESILKDPYRDRERDRNQQAKIISFVRRVQYFIHYLQ
jgi:hypothetical protein